jgi:diguanylate cyclase (GGDEF)-like protein
MLFDLDGFKSYNDTFGHPAGDALLVRLAAKLTHAAGEHGLPYRVGGDEFCILLDARGDAEVVRSDLEAALSEHGDGFAITASGGVAEIPSEAGDAVVAMQLADRRMYERKGASRPSAASQARDVLLAALAERQPELHEHLQDVAVLAVAVGRRLGLEPERLDEVARAAELHDIGKMAVPDAIVNKPTTLSDDEWTFMRRHTVIGQSILAAAPAMVPVARLVRSSHERWDGGGYPDGLAATDIPLGARIVFACDAYDAMTSERVYRRAMPAAEALAELRRCAGTQFDPGVVDALSAVLSGATAVARTTTPAPAAR